MCTIHFISVCTWYLSMTCASHSQRYVAKKFFQFFTGYQATGVSIYGYIHISGFSHRDPETCNRATCIMGDPPCDLSQGPGLLRKVLREIFCHHLLSDDCTPSAHIIAVMHIPFRFWHRNTGNFMRKKSLSLMSVIWSKFPWVTPLVWNNCLIHCCLAF